ncbi:MptD family putative ECF transporter S component [Ruminococcus sp.]|uniref:MptD family putative ECF transporter S component n=3 Tax=Ruminococcus sp. TaxID=41978 RepID=UPI002CF6F116|nr:MptD family putative ECF transporter S component [Ruminococcus sp.]HOH86256.1 MptD family putative ECF transporter S component [Ruminococcus sp.]
MNVQRSSNGKMKGKELITVGIFSAIYFAINLVFMVLGGLHPIIWILMPAFIALFTGVPYMLLCAKVPKIGAIMLMGLITGIIYFATGTFTVVILVAFLLACILAEAIRYMTGFRSSVGNLLSYVAFSVGMIGSPLPIWLFRNDFLAQIKEQGIGEHYVQVLDDLATGKMLVIMIILTIVCAFIGAAVAKVLFRKHFEKAGIV